MLRIHLKLPEDKLGARNTTECVLKEAREGMSVFGFVNMHVVPPRQALFSPGMGVKFLYARYSL